MSIGHRTRCRPFKGAGILFAHRAAGQSWDVLLFRRSIAPDLGMWSVVGGRQDAGESFEQTAIREAVEEALYPARQPEAFLGTLRPYLSPTFDIATCRTSVVSIPFAFTYHTFLVEFAERPPLSVFRPHPDECDACEWFPATRLPPDVHRGVRWSVRRFGLLSSKPQS